MSVWPASCRSDQLHVGLTRTVEAVWVISSPSCYSVLCMKSAKDSCNVRCLLDHMNWTCLLMMSQMRQIALIWTLTQIIVHSTSLDHATWRPDWKFWEGDFRWEFVTGIVKMKSTENSIENSAHTATINSNFLYANDSYCLGRGGFCGSKDIGESNVDNRWQKNDPHLTSLHCHPTFGCCV